MFRFAHPQYLFLLTLLPVLVAGYVIICRRKKRQLRQLGEPWLIEQLMPNKSTVRPAIKFTLELLAFASIVFALARPQFGTSPQTVKRQGIELMIAVDVSNSMLAEDKTSISRLDRAKQLLSKIIDDSADDRVGLIVFAGDAYIQLPITCDYVSAKMYLNNISTNAVPRQGTSIGAAINMAVNAFGEPNDKSRAIIVITDGEDHNDDAESAAKAAHEQGIEIFVVGIGKTEGSPIPISGSSDFKRDRSGNVVITKLNEQMCREIAQAGGGVYVHADNSNSALRALRAEINKLAKSEIESKVYTAYNEQYQSFVILALIFIAIDYLLLGRKNKRLSRINLFESKDNRQ